MKKITSIFLILSLLLSLWACGTGEKPGKTGGEHRIFTDDAGFFATFLYVALGQAVVVYGLGLPLSHIIKKTKIF